MPALALPSFHIQGFRGFSDLRIERLGRVNLIVGKNNVGKSSLLEALHVYANRAYPQLIWDLLDARDEGIQSIQRISVFRDQEPEDPLLPIRYLFFGLPDLQHRHKANLKLGLVESVSQTLEISIDHLALSSTAEARNVEQGVQFDTAEEWLPFLTTRFGRQPASYYARPPLWRHIGLEGDDTHVARLAAGAGKADGPGNY